MFRHRGRVEEKPQKTGIYTCSNCGNILFEANKKFDVGSGYPSFWEQVGENVQHKTLNTYGRQRVQLLCSQCQNAY